MTEPFAGTMFRLPLRTAAQASTSRLSPSIPDMATLQVHTVYPCLLFNYFAFYLSIIIVYFIIF
jgi:hypothetical protein